jgi:hypothetical protein
MESDLKGVLHAACMLKKEFKVVNKKVQTRLGRTWSPFFQATLTEMAQQQRHAATISLDAACAITAANTAAATAAGTASALTAMTQALQQPQSQAVTNGRDPMLEAFEKYLLNNLRGSDVAQDSEGILLFNVNQVAYLVEGCATQGQKSEIGRAHV